MIVKVQISQASSDGLKHMLVYNEDRSVMYQEIATPDIVTIMQGEAKRFFHAKIKKLKKERRIQIEAVAPWQNW